MIIAITTLIKVHVSTFSKADKTLRGRCCLYIGFTIFERGLKQSVITVSTGIKLKKGQWKNNEVIGKRELAEEVKERIQSFMTESKNLLNEISIRRIDTCSEISNELQLNAKHRLTGKAPKKKEVKEAFLSKMKQYSYLEIMNKLIEERNICKGRQRGYQRSYQLLLEYFKRLKPIDQITKKDLEGFKQWYVKSHNVSINTTTDYMAKIAAVIKYACKLEIITSNNPLPDCFRGTWKDANRIVLSEEECLKLINLEEDHLSNTLLISKYCLLVSMLTGISYCDLRDISQKHLKYDSNMCKWFIEKPRNKSKQLFKVYLSSMAEYAVNRLKELTANSLSLFELPSIDYMNRMYRVLTTRAGISSRVTTTVLRHTFSVIFIENDGRLEDLKRYLGHSNIKTTAIYGKISDKRLAIKINELENKSIIHRYNPI